MRLIFAICFSSFSVRFSILYAIYKQKDFFLFSFLSATIVTNNNNNNKNNNKKKNNNNNNNNDNKTAHSKLSVYRIKNLVIHD